MYLYVLGLLSTCRALRGPDWPREFDRAAFERYLDPRPAARVKRPAAVAAPAGARLAALGLEKKLS